MNTHPFTSTGLRYHPPLTWTRNLRKGRVWLQLAVSLFLGISLLGAIAAGVPMPLVLTLYFAVNFGAVVLEWRNKRSQVTFSEEGFVNRHMGVEMEYHFDDLVELDVMPPMGWIIPNYRLTWTDRHGVEDGVLFWFWSPKKRRDFEAWVSMARQRPDVAMVRFVYE